MKQFENILVAVDLADDDLLVSNGGPPHSQHAVQEALWLAAASGAKLTFFHSLDISEMAQRLILEENLENNVRDKALASLQRMVDRAVAEGSRADCAVTFGRSWQQIIRRAVEHNHDLVIAGTRHPSRLRSVLFGSTGMKLLRLCPAPVWLTHPRDRRELRSIVVATDLTEVSNRVVDVAANLAGLYGAQLHLLHVIHPATTSELRGIGLPLMRIEEHQRAQREHAEKMLQQQVDRPTVKALPQPANVILTCGEPDEEILKTLSNQNADLLVMATLGRTGIPGMVIGNTAERLLPHLQCSVLAIKPDGFVSSAVQ